MNFPDWKGPAMGNKMMPGLVAQTGRYGPQGDERLRFDGVLQSPCGPVEIPRPTRAALIASALDWAQQIRLEDAHDVEKISPRGCNFIATRLRRHAEKIEQALGELAMMEESK